MGRMEGENVREVDAFRSHFGTGGCARGWKSEFLLLKCEHVVLLTLLARETARDRRSDKSVEGKRVNTS